MEEQLLNRIEDVLDAYVRPSLLTHMGDLEVAGLDEEGTLWVLMTGECAGCPSSNETITGLVEKELVSRIPEIRRVDIDNGITDEVYGQVLQMLSRKQGH